MIKPYGAPQLTNGFISQAELDALSKKPGIMKLPCDPYLAMECERIADGSFTPITGFVGKADIDSIIEKDRLTSGVYFPIPIILQVPESLKNVKDQHVFLVSAQNEILGYIENATAFTYDLERFCLAVFGTNDQKHAGVARYKSRGPYLLSGTVKMTKRKNPFSEACLSPNQVREHIEKAGWPHCVAFQTRNVPHKAHEYLQRVALEVYGALLIHPVIGWKKKGDYNPDVVLKTYTYMVEHIYPRNRVLLSGLQYPMYYAGPKEAVLHAIIRQNYGCTHFIVGRDHAGVGKFYGKYDGHKLARKVQHHLDIKFLCLKGPAFCKPCDGIVTENTCCHPEETHIDVSGSFIRESLNTGIYPSKDLIRSELIDIIREFDQVFVES